MALKGFVRNIIICYINGTGKIIGSALYNLIEFERKLL